MLDRQTIGVLNKLKSYLIRGYNLLDLNGRQECYIYRLQDKKWERHYLVVIPTFDSNLPRSKAIIPWGDLLAIIDTSNWRCYMSLHVYTNLGDYRRFRRLLISLLDELPKLIPLVMF